MWLKWPHRADRYGGHGSRWRCSARIWRHRFLV